MRNRTLLLALAVSLAGSGLTGCGGGKTVAATTPAAPAPHLAVQAMYPAVGVTLVAVPRGYRPAVSRSTVVHLLRKGKLSLGTGRPSVTLEGVKAADAPGGAYPAWVFTYRHTRPVSYGLRAVPGTPDCTSVVIYSLTARVWTQRFQTCPDPKPAPPSCDFGCTPANQEMLDAAANKARKIAGAYYTGVVVSNPTNNVILYLAHAPHAVLERLNTAEPGIYVIHNDAPRPRSVVMRIMRSFDYKALRAAGITVVQVGPTEDGYLRVGVTDHVADAQARLDAKYGSGIIQVFKGEMAIPVSLTVRPRVSSH